MDGVIAYDCAQDGLNFSSGTNVTIRNCEVSGSGSINGAIYVYTSDGVVVESNSVHDSATDHAIMLYKNEGELDVVENRIEDIAFTSGTPGHMPG